MSVLETGRDVVATVREENVPFMAASIAYYGLASIVPLLVVSLALLSAVGATAALVDLFRSLLTERWQTVFEQVLANTRGHGTAGVVGLVFTVWSGSKVFRGLAIAFTEVYGAASTVSLPARLGRSLLVMGLLLSAVGLLSATSVVLAYADLRIPYPLVVGAVTALGVLSVTFVPIYYVLPPVETTVRHVLPGTVLAAVGWVTIPVAFRYYAGVAGQYAAYGYIGAVLLFVTALYLAAVVLLLGGVVNAALDW